MKKFIITEEERGRILGMHKTATSKHYLMEDEVIGKSNFYCASNVGKYVKCHNNDCDFIFNKGAHDGKNGYRYGNDGRVYIVDGDGLSWNSSYWPGWLSDEGESAYLYWYCKCEGGKCKVDISNKKKEHECKVPNGNNCGTDNDQDDDCDKLPMELVVSMGLNWKETKQKWFDLDCMGTTPCIKGDAKTNINLRDAICNGTWDPKNDTDF
jgi:hypothetical protein